MTTITNPHLLLPAGAVWVDDVWGDQGTPDESRYFNHQEIPVEGTVLMIVGVQYARGTCGRTISLHTEQSTADVSVDLTPQAARRLAAMLQNLADTCEILDEAQR